MSKMFYKMLCIVLVVMMAFSFLTGCGSKESTQAAGSTAATESSSDQTLEEPAQEPVKEVKLTFWNGFTASDGEVLRDIINRFNENNTSKVKIEMDIMPWDVFFQKLPPAIATNTAPSFVLMGADNIMSYVQNEAIAPLDDFWQTTGLSESNYDKNVIDIFKYDGKTYMTPMQYFLVYLYWNKELFKGAGLDPNKAPATFEELEQYALKLTDASKNRFGFGMSVKGAPPYFASLLWGNGGDFWDIQGKKSLLNSPENIQTLKWIQDLAVNKKITPNGATGADIDNMFMNGQVAMFINGPWVINGINTAGIDFGIAAPPKGSVAQASPTGGYGYAITSSKLDEEKAAIYEYLKYWMSHDILKEWTVKNGFPAWSTEVLNDPEVKNDPVQGVIGGLGSIGKNYNFGLPESSKINDIIWPVIEGTLAGSDVESIVKKANDDIDKVLASTK